MKLKEVRSAADMILNASNTEVAIVSLLVYVSVLGGVSILIKSSVFLLVFTAIYIVAIIVLIFGRIHEKKFSLARDRILIFLRTKFIRVGYERLRRHFNDPSYTDTFIKKLLKKYPKELKSCIMKGGAPGITLAPDELQKLKAPKKQ